MSKHIKIYAPVSGDTKDITRVDDPVFAQKLVGDGIAISPSQNIICSPCNGEINHIFPTNHAFTIIDENGLEILVHLGIDTVDLKGVGFSKILPNNQKIVKVGEPIIEMDCQVIEEYGKKTDVIVIVTDSNSETKIKKKIKRTIALSDEIMKVLVRKK